MNDASTPARAPVDERTLGGRGAAVRRGADREGDPVLDLLYAGVAIAVFAILLLAVRGLDRL